jgi:hypothetical protein
MKEVDCVVTVKRRQNMCGSAENTTKLVFFVPPYSNLVILVVPIFVDWSFSKNQQ